MHPAFSVIFLTTLIGAGQGLFLALYTGQIYAAVELLPPQSESSFYGIGSAIALALLIGGLIASFFHLGRPERAWRSATRWRTSWLSREVIMLPALMGLLAIYGGLHWFGINPQLVQMGQVDINLTLVVGALATLVCFGLFICTGMIYAAVKFIREWACALTVINYILLGGASGFTLAAAFSAFVGADLVGFYGNWAVVLTLLALATRGASLIRNARLAAGRIKPTSTDQTALGIRHPQVNQRSMGFMGGSFNTREFFHGAPEATFNSAKRIFLLLVFPVPVALLAIAYITHSGLLPVVAFIAQYVGLLFERWFFFAQASHPQNLYYRSVA